MKSSKPMKNLHILKRTISNLTLLSSEDLQKVYGAAGDDTENLDPIIQTMYRCVAC